MHTRQVHSLPLFPEIRYVIAYVILLPVYISNVSSFVHTIPNRVFLFLVQTGFKFKLLIQYNSKQDCDLCYYYVDKVGFLLIKYVMSHSQDLPKYYHS